MGYDTDFSGELKFTSEATASQLAMLAKMLGEDIRDHKEWHKLTAEARDLTHMDLKPTADYSGLEWNGSEKSYDMPEKVNLVIAYMHTKFPNFSLEGQLAAQGEETEDRWALVMVDGKAERREVALAGTVVVCPHCGESFSIEEGNT